MGEDIYNKVYKYNAAFPNNIAEVLKSDWL